MTDIMPTPEQVADLAERLADGEPPETTADALGVDKQTVFRWSRTKAVKLAFFGVECMRGRCPHARHGQPRYVDLSSIDGTTRLSPSRGSFGLGAGR